MVPAGLRGVKARDDRPAHALRPGVIVVAVIVDAHTLAEPYLQEVQAEVAALGAPVRLVGILASEQRPSEVYSHYAARGCERVGIHYEQRRVPTAAVLDEVVRANHDPSVHGVMVFYPIYGGEADRALQNAVSVEKDVEGLHALWSQLLYGDVRTIDPEGKKKAILPCTPLGIVKALEGLGAYRPGVPERQGLAGREVTVFNRSDVVGRPLAAMLAHDGACVWSFDVDSVWRFEGTASGPTERSRADALAASDIVITGVPSRDFPLVRADEVRPGALCVNFSTVKNFADDVADRAGCLLKRVGPITVAMLLRNTVRLYRNFHRPEEEGPRAT